MERQDDPELWDLLSQSPVALQISGNFADATLRRIRLGKPAPVRNARSWWSWAFAPAFASAVALLASFSLRSGMPSGPSSQIAEIASTAQLLAVNDVEDVDSLDELLNEEDNNLWLENSTF